MARVASTALLRVMASKSPKVDPRNRAIWSPHQSKSFSKGTIEMKHTGPELLMSNNTPRPRRWYSHPKVVLLPQSWKCETQATGSKSSNTFKSGG